LFLQAEAMTVGTDTTTQANSALMSGSSNNYTRTTFATQASMQTRLSTTTKFPTSSSVDARGTYRVFARVRQNASSMVIDMRLKYGSTTVQITNDTVRLPVDTGPSAPTIKFVDLGLVQIPIGYDPIYDGVTNTEWPTEGVYLEVQAQRVSGSSSLDIDFLLWLPADDRVQFVKWPETQALTTDVFVLEGGARSSAYCLTGTPPDRLASVEPIEIAGSGMMVTPGRTNRLVVVIDLATGTALTGAGSVVTRDLTITPHYYPRYLFPLKATT